MRDLKGILFPMGVLTSSTVAKQALAELSLDSSLYSVDRTLAYLDAFHQKSAERINNQTHKLVSLALTDNDDDWRQSILGTGRAGLLATTFATAMSGFGTHEAGKQTGIRRKQWVTGHNPRPTHAALNGETVDIDSRFSNGLMYPGSGGGDSAGCNCSLSLVREVRE